MTLTTPGQGDSNDESARSGDDLPTTVTESDAMLCAAISATLHARLDWKQSDACAADVVNLFYRKGWRVVREATPTAASSLTSDGG